MGRLWKDFTGDIYMITQNKSLEDKKYPDDYTKEQREQIKEIVIARIKQMPDNFRVSLG